MPNDTLFPICGYILRTHIRVNVNGHSEWMAEFRMHKEVNSEFEVFHIDGYLKT